MSKLILARHHESEWNKLGTWTGTRDTHLTSFGFEKSEDMGLLIKDIHIDVAFASMQVRTIETLSRILDVCKLYDVPTEHAKALNERDYGEYTGKNKWDMKKILGEVEFKKMRRGWDYPVPKGETLKMVYERTVPFFLENILPKVNEGKNVLVVAHGNSLRSVLKYIEKISDEGIEDVEFPFGAVMIYELDKEGHVLSKEVRVADKDASNEDSQAQIVASIGPASGNKEMLERMLEQGMDAVRFNFSWSTPDVRLSQIKLVRDVAKESDKKIIIIQDLPGPRIQEGDGHTHDTKFPNRLTEHDKELIPFGVEHDVDYIALSFIASSNEINECRQIIKNNNGRQKIIAKVERREAVDNIDEIISSADAVMIARGDLGNEFPLEKIPFIQDAIIGKCKKAEKPVITATQMLLSMTENPKPSRAEVTDVANAILEGSDAVMLSEETTVGKHPVEAVAMMKRIIIEAEHHMGRNTRVYRL